MISPPPLVTSPSPPRRVFDLLVIVVVGGELQEVFGTGFGPVFLAALTRRLICLTVDSMWAEVIGRPWFRYAG